MLLAHALEKGMGLPNPRPKFGKEKAIKLIKLLEEYCDGFHDLNRYAFAESVSILGSYFQFTDNDMSSYLDRYQSLKQKVNLLPAGNIYVEDITAIYSEFEISQAENFMLLRHSIRSFEKQCVDDELICKILSLANHAPSACNRQPVKVYITNELSMVDKVSSLIPGNIGFEDEVPNWVIVTVDRRMFGTNEVLQWYVNGGIYLSYLVEAMHAYHIGSCIFQIPLTHPNSQKLYKLISIPKNEAIIAGVGFGYAKSKNKFLSATRRPVDEVCNKF